MKKIIASVLILGAMSTAVQAQTDTTRKTYYYYPQENIYYNPATMDYHYYDSATTRWNTGKELPKTYVVPAKDRYETVYYNGVDVWMANPDHRKTFVKPAPAPPKK